MRLLWDRLAIPIFVLVDADPFGIEIMFTYRWIPQDVLLIL